MELKYVVNEDKSLTVDDVIYGKIEVPYPFSEIVMTKEMQRLAGITQTGFSQLEFKGLADEDRLSHSIGAFHVMSLFLDRLDSILKEFDIELSQDDKDIALCSMLLHDIGHGPFSHSLEGITHYSHEKRTTDILLGDTEVNKVITKFFGENKVKRIASFIAEINEEDLESDSFTRLLNNLVSYQLDADRIDYLLRDSYYVGYSTAVDLERILSSVGVVVNNNQEYELLIERSGLASIENVLLQRYQMYRDVYLCPASILGDFIFQNIIERYREDSLLQDSGVNPNFKRLAMDPRISNLDDFVNMKDKDFQESFEVLAKNTVDPVIAYLCEFNIDDFILINNDVSIDEIKNRLKEIFEGFDIDNTISVMDFVTNIKLYKKEQKLNILNRNRIMDLTECTNLIRPQEVFKDKFIYFNPKLLQKELGLSDKEFLKYEGKVMSVVDEMNKKPEEFELKYIVKDSRFIDDDSLFKNIIKVFKDNGFSVVSTLEKQNNDEYYDTRNMDLFNSGSSIRIRNIIEGNNNSIKVTCKMPLGKGAVYSSRSEIEEKLDDSKFDTFKNKLDEIGITSRFTDILNFPIINSCTNRRDVVLSKNGVEVCLSFDNTVYTNHLLNEVDCSDKMIEIEAIGELNNRVILNEIHNFISSSFDNLDINKQSKYERGVKSTLKKYNTLNKDASVLVKKINEKK